MNRQLLIIDEIKYLVEFINYSEQTKPLSAKFNMYRNFNIQNNIAVDLDLYFVSNDEIDSNIIWPIINNENKQYSLNKESFNKLNNDIYKIYYDNECTEEAYIQCDEIRIYKPVNRKNISSIIHIYNIVNDINIHYLCKFNNDYNINICNEFEYNNEKYNEYISIFIPNTEYLFKGNNLWYKEDMNNYVETYNYINNLGITEKISNEINYNNRCVPLVKLIESYIIHEDKTTNNFVKVFYKEYESTISNYINIPLNITLVKSELKHTLTGDIVIDNIFGFTSFINEYYFLLKSKIDFDDNGMISLINVFEYPNKHNFSSIDKAYFYYNNVTNEEEYYNFNGWENSEFYDILADEYEDDFNLVTFNAAGYYIELASDVYFENIIYKSQHETKIIQDFAFSLNGIFSTWQQWPGQLFARALYIDKYLSKIIYGNIVVITKEQFKYCINKTQIYKLNLIDKLNNNMNTDNFNFINKINCIVNKSDTNANKLNVSNGFNQIIYKPIFYKVNDLQSIKLRNNVIQNIGVNLNEYLSKFSEFILEIENYEFTEYARNDMYVIFKVNPTNLTNMAGYYNILNQDHEYITSGSYTIF